MIIESHLGQERFHLQERKKKCFMVNPTLGLENIVNTIHIDNISTNLDGNSRTNEFQCPKVDCTATESENNHLASKR